MEGRGSIPQRIGEQLYFTFAAMAVASAIAVPLGWLIGHTGRGRDIAVAITGAARALPSFGLLFLFVMIAGVLLREPSARAHKHTVALSLTSKCFTDKHNAVTDEQGGAELLALEEQ